MITVYALYETDNDIYPIVLTREMLSANTLRAELGYEIREVEMDDRVLFLLPELARENK